MLIIKTLMSIYAIIMTTTCIYASSISDFITQQQISASTITTLSNDESNGLTSRQTFINLVKYSAGVSYWRKGQYDKFLDFIKSAAQSGHKVSIQCLAHADINDVRYKAGLMHMRAGRYRTAFRVINTAAQAGHKNAKIYLARSDINDIRHNAGLRYLEVNLIDNALELFKSAAESGHRASIEYLKRTDINELKYNVAETYLDAKEYKDRKYDDAVSLLTSAAKSGHRDSNFRLGQLYIEGKGCDKNYTTAYAYLLKAADAGELDAQHHIAQMCYYGLGVTEDKKRSFELYRKIIDTCNDDNKYGLYLFSYGELMEIEADEGYCSYDMAYTYYKRAVDFNYKKALMSISNLIIDKNLDIDEWEKIFIDYKYLVDIDNDLNPYYSNSVAKSYYSGKGAIKNYTQAFKYYLKAAEINDTLAQNKVGYLYQIGRGTQQNHIQARYWFERAQPELTAKSQYFLGKLYHKGLGCCQDINRAIKLYTLSALRKHAKACHTLGEIYQLGIKSYNGSLVIKSNLDHALFFYKKAAKLGLAKAQLQIGLMYLENCQIDSTNKVKGYKYLQRAIDQNYSDAMFELAVFYLNPKNPEPDQLRAMLLLTKAAMKGHKYAINLLNNKRKLDNDDDE